MLEKILEITRIQRVNHYNSDQQSSRDSLKRKPKLNFENILEKKIKASQTVISDPYKVSLTQIPR